MKWSLIFALAVLPLTAQVTITSTSPLPPGVATNPYSFTMAVSGGIGPYTWIVTGGQLPSGLTLALNGVVSGTPNLATVSSFTIQVTDGAASPSTDTKNFGLRIAPRITTTTLPTSTVFQPYPGTTLNAAGLSGSPTWSAVGLPNGMSISSAGLLAGTPTAIGNFTPTFFVLDPSGSSGAANIPLTINPAVAITDSSPLPGGDLVVAYSYQFGSASSPVSGGTPPYTWSTPTALPPGLSLSSGGLLAGTPTQTGLFTFGIQVADNAGATNGKTFSLAIGTVPVQVTILRAPPASTIGVPYPPPSPALQPPYFQATQGTGTYSWTASGLPAGVSVSPITGSLSGIVGTPTASGTFPVSVTATDPLNENATLNFNLTINPAPAINTNPLQPCTAGTSCTRTLSVTGGTPPFVWQLITGSVPPGMSFSNGGVISGTPNAVVSPTTSHFTVRATDIATASDTQQLSLLVNPAIAISPSTLPPTTSGIAYSQTLSASGGTGAIAFSATGLPAWLTLTGGGLLSGTAPSVSTPTSFPFSVKATDSINASTTNSYTVVVNPLPSITTASPLPPWTVNRPYSQTIAATGGTGALIFTDNGATLPAWLALSTAGVLSGTPPAAGPVNFTVRVTDSLLAFATKAFALTINPPPSVTTTSLPATTPGTAYNQTLAETGGTSPFTWQGTGLPAWLTLSTAGVLTGTAPTVSSPTPFNFSVTVTDTAGAISAAQSLSVTVSPQVQITTSSPLPPTESGLSYSQTLAATGSAAAAIAFSSADLPSWLTLSSAGVLGGTAPTVASPTQYSFNVSATDGVTTVSKAFSVTVNPAVTIATPSPLPPWTLNQPYSQSVTAAGGLAPYTFADAGTTLPQWLAISSTGALTGTPPAAGTFNFSLKVTDALTGTNTKAFALTINAALSITTTSLPPTTSGLAYHQTLTESGGTGGFTFSATNLPEWLTLTGATLNGTAPAVSSATPFNFSVTVTDSTGAVSPARPLSITVNPAVTITTSSPLPSSASGSSYSQTFTASGGTGTINWTFSNLPSWLSQNGAALGGTAPTVTQPTQFTFTATATDSLGASSPSRTFTVTVTVGSGVIITTGATLGPWTATRFFSVSLAATGGTPPYTFSGGNTLPGGLTLNGNVLSGTPPSPGSFSFTITATDTLNSAGAKTFSLLINPGPSVTTTSLPATTSGVQYSQGLSASGGTQPLDWSGANLPGWLVLNGSALAGTAPMVAVATQYGFTVTVTDVAGATGAQSLSVTVNPPVTITTTSPLPPAPLGSPYSVTFGASGGTGTLAWTASNLPSWLSLSGSTLSGTPPVSAAGSTVSFSVRAADTVGGLDSKNFQIAVGGGAPAISGNPPAWTVNRPYSASLSATGGTPPYTNWSVTSGSLPAGLQLNSSGTIAGTPGASGTAQFTVAVTDSNGQTGSAQLSLTINPAPAIPAQSLHPASPGATYTQTLINTGGTGPFTWSATGLSGSGLTLTSTGVLTGVPTATLPATINFTASLTDAAGATAQAGLSLTVSSAISISTSGLPVTTSTAPYSASVSATGGTGTIGFSAAPGTLPVWLSLSSQGTLAGIAPIVAAPTDFTFIITAADSAGAAVSRTFTITVNPVPRVHTTTLPAGTAGAPYSAQLAGVGGTGTLVWSAQNLPAWASLNSSSGAISGTPPAAATVTISVVATDALAISSPPVSLILQIDAQGGTPSITVACPLGPTTAGLVFGQAATATGGFPPYSWSATGLPSWLLLNANGVFSGTAVAGSTAFTLKATDSQGQIATVGCGISVHTAPFVTAAALAHGTVGAPYAQSLSAVGGTGALLWSSSTLPGWLALQPLTGALSGTPAAAGNYGFTVQVTDSVGAASAPASFIIRVTSPGGAPTITACPLPAGSVGSPISFQLTGALGLPPYAWSVSGLPAGLNATSAGVVSGTPSSAGTSSVGLTVTDAANLSARANCAMSIFSRLTVTTTSLPDGTVGAFYSQRLAAVGGVGTLSWSASGAPAWLVPDSNSGTLSGTPSAGGLYGFTVQVTDSQGARSASASLSVNVTPQGGGLVITTACPLPDITQSMLLAQTFTAQGGSPPYSWTSQGLPAGVSLSSAGALSGVPLAGTITFSVQATDRQQQTTSTNCSVRVNPKPGIVTTSLSDGNAGTPYSGAVAATGGTAPLAWSGDLPYWLGIDKTSGVLSGTPPAGGTVSASIRVSDALGITDSKTFSFTIAASGSGTAGSTFPALTTACPLPGATAGVGYSQVLTAAGGFVPYRFFVSGLPVGMAFSSSGTLSGTPQSGGTAQLVVQVIDLRGNTATTPCSLTVAPPLPLSAIAVSTPDGKVNQSYSGRLSVTGGVPPFTWSISAGALPPGVNLDPASGALSGTPTGSGTYTFTAKVMDLNGATGTTAGSITIAPSLLITTPSALPDSVAGAAYRQALVSSGASGAVTWSMVDGALPNGLTLDSAAGVISGSPTEVGTFQFTLQALDSARQQALQKFTLAVRLAALPLVTITGLPATLAPNQQPSVGVTLAAPYALDITGQLNLTVAADPSIGRTDPAVQFASGGVTVPFRIPANSTQAVFTLLPSFQTGTLAGTLKLDVALQTAGVSVQPPASAAVTGQIPKLAPAIVGTPTVTRTANGLQVTIIGFATSREVTSGTFHFTGANLQSSDVTIPLGTQVSAWFNDPQSDTFGSRFQLVQSFTIQGNASQVTGVAITLTNSQGSSAQVSVTF